MKATSGLLDLSKTYEFIKHEKGTWNCENCGTAISNLYYITDGSEQYIVGSECIETFLKLDGSSYWKLQEEKRKINKINREINTLRKYYNAGYKFEDGWIYDNEGRRVRFYFTKFYELHKNEIEKPIKERKSADKRLKYHTLQNEYGRFIVDELGYRQLGSKELRILIKQLKANNRIGKYTITSVYYDLKTKQEIKETKTFEIK